MRNKSKYFTSTRWAILGVTGMLVSPFSADAQQNEVSITEQDGFRVITSNGIPDHATGDFPNRNNPNQISSQRHNFKVPLNPEEAGSPTTLGLWPFGVAINGIPFDPGAAEFWNRDFNSGWQYEALGGGVNLGTDGSNAHVQPTGAYHYHGLPTALIKNRGNLTSPVHIGFAADGFPMYNQFCDAAGTSEKMYASYTIKSGQRSGGPGGRHTGEFIQDYGFKSGLGTLDEYNGHETITKEYPKGIYHYHLTETFPYIPRSFRGTPDTSFLRGGPGGPGRHGGRPPHRQGGEFNGRPPHHPPPPPNHGQFQNSGQSFDDTGMNQQNRNYDVSRNFPDGGQQYDRPQSERYDGLPSDQYYGEPENAPHGEQFNGPSNRGYGPPQDSQYNGRGYEQQGENYNAQQTQGNREPRDMPHRGRSQDRDFNGPPDQRYGAQGNDPRRDSANGHQGGQQYRYEERPRREHVSQFGGPGWQPDGRYVGSHNRMRGQERFGHPQGGQQDRRYGGPPKGQVDSPQNGQRDQGFNGPPQNSYRSPGQSPQGQRFDGPPQGRQPGQRFNGPPQDSYGRPGQPPQRQNGGPGDGQFRGPQERQQGQGSNGPPQGGPQGKPGPPPQGNFDGEQDGRLNGPPPQGNFGGPQDGPPPPPENSDEGYPPYE